MREQVWLAAKRGEERRFVSARPPSPEYAAVLHAEGYTIFRIEFEMPGGWDLSDGVLQVTTVEETE